MYEIPGRSAICATSFAVWFASDGYRTVLADRHPGVRAAHAEGGAADRGHADEVVRARQETGEGRRERVPPPHLEADCSGDHLLLRDVHLEVAVGMGVAEDLGEGRVRHLAVDGDDVAADRAESSERVAV